MVLTKSPMSPSASGRLRPEMGVPTLRSVVDHYSSCHDLKLSDGEKGDLVQYLRSR